MWCGAAGACTGLRLAPAPPFSSFHPPTHTLTLPHTLSHTRAPSQSNLSGGNTPLSYAFNATEEVAAAANYPWIRLFTVGTPPGADAPLQQLAEGPRIPWGRASPANAAHFSATCWFTGKRLADALGDGVPLGLVESAWGGVRLGAAQPSIHARAFF